MNEALSTQVVSSVGTFVMPGNASHKSSLERRVILGRITSVRLVGSRLSSAPTALPRSTTQMPLLPLPPSMKEFAQKRGYKTERSRLVATVIASVAIVNKGFW